MPRDRNAPTPSIYQDHDGSWTWSLEIGEAFEPGHKVIARDEGYPTRGDAKEAMLEALARYQESLEKKPASKPPAAAPAKPAAAKKKSGTGKAAEAPRAAARTAAAPDGNPEWAVLVDGQIVALFVDSDQARKFADSAYRGRHSIQQVTYAIALTPRES